MKAFLLIIAFKTAYYLYGGIFLFSVLMLVLISFMLIYISFKKRLIKKEKKRRHIAELLVHKAVFFEADQVGPDNNMFFRGTKLVRDFHFRTILTEEILTAKANISGEPSLRLKVMYGQLKLEQHALRKLRDRRWYKKAQGIQELAIMDLGAHINQISPFADDPHELVRIEAQTAMVKLAGYQGLYFLDTATYPITDWQQIKLLKEIPNLPTDDNLHSIANWLRTSNETVVIFAMKIARTYHLFQLHDAIIACLENRSEKVRREAIRTLKVIHLEQTSGRLRAIFPSETLINKIEIVKSLQFTGSQEDVAFLLSFLQESDYIQKLAILRTIAYLSKSTLTELIPLPGREQFPLQDMIRQINMEITG